ncbi:ATP-dependent protease La [Helicostylum pulchrum]|nr:ATP-dependent protease La [Helicostylum pulchrum]
MNQNIPFSLPILPLAEYVLLPSIVTTFMVYPSEADYLTNQTSDYVICVPLADKKRNKTHATDLSQLFHYGCVAKVIECDRTLPDICVLKVEGVCRSRIRDVSNSDGGGQYKALLEHYPDQVKDLCLQDQMNFQTVVAKFIEKMKYIGVSISVLNELGLLVDRCHISHVANLMLCIMDSPFCDKLRVLEQSDTKQRLTQVNDAVNRYLKMINVTSTNNQNEMLFDSIRRKFYLLQEVNSISYHQQEEQNYQFKSLGQDDEEILDLVRKLNQAKLPEYAVTAVKRDLNRLRKLPESSSDSAVLRIYIEYMADLPWQNMSATELNISSAKQQLDADHFGIHHVKKRILEYLSVLKVKKDAKPPIICFVGPPGVGKTTLGMSIATALKRKFHRMSLGGVRDEAEIRGHRRTYVGALPGLFIHGMRQCGVQNPVFLLDEIDKLVQGTNQGDPSAALLEVLDPAQNSTFTDHFLNLPYDLSQVLFIATANSVDTIPKPLLDRMEVIQLDGYTFNEKLHITQTHLLPKQIKAHGLCFLDLGIPDQVVMHVAEKYTRESGVRGLERLMANICRYKCCEYTNLEEAGNLERFKRLVDVDDIQGILGSEPFEDDMVESEDMPGVITGLAYSGSGNGGIMFVEASKMPGSGNLHLTGSLGDVIQESAKLALSWVKSNAFTLKLTSHSKENLVQHDDIHIHFPSGAISKNGPSAGVTLVCAIVSLYSGYHVSPTTAMTGEISLRGRVLPVGGIKEKVVSAHRAGIRKIILPFRNRKDVEEDVPDKVKNDIQFVFAKSIWDVLEAALIMNTSDKWSHRIYESRL